MYSATPWGFSRTTVLIPQELVRMILKDLGIFGVTKTQQTQMYFVAFFWLIPAGFW
jgi:hypothetical protein